MGWEQRGNGRYYYRKRKVNGRVMSEYVGSGVVAEWVAGQDAAEAQRREAQRRQHAAMVSADAELRRQLDDYGRAVRVALAVILPALGCYQHKRQWRKRAMSDLPTAQDVTALLNKKRHTKADMATLRQWLQDAPELADLVDLPRTVKRAHIVKTFGDDKASRLMMDKKTAQMWRDMGGDVSPLWEQLLIDDVILTWLRLQYVQYCLANADTPEGIAFWDKRTNAAQRRHLRAIETLARIRKLNLPPIQLNIAENQVNIAT